MTVIPASNSSVNITIQQLPASLRNGIILNYTVYYRSLESDDITTVRSGSTTPSEQRSLEITDLDIFSRYQFFARAFTSVGPGPQGENVTARTLTGRELELYVRSSSHLCLYLFVRASVILWYCFSIY